MAKLPTNLQGLLGMFPGATAAQIQGLLGSAGAAAPAGGAPAFKAFQPMQHGLTYGQQRGIIQGFAQNAGLLSGGMTSQPPAPAPVTPTPTPTAPKPGSTALTQATFDATRYLKDYPALVQGLKQHGLTPWQHYTQYGKAAGKIGYAKPAGLLSGAPTTSTAPTGTGGPAQTPAPQPVTQPTPTSGAVPITQANFDAQAYLARYPQLRQGLAQHGLTPWQHYSQYGQRAGKIATARAI